VSPGRDKKKMNGMVRKEASRGTSWGRGCPGKNKSFARSRSYNALGYSRGSVGGNYYVPREKCGRQVGDQPRVKMKQKVGNERGKETRWQKTNVP